jgi:hypothetical protein
LKGFLTRQFFVVVIQPFVLVSQLLLLLLQVGISARQILNLFHVEIEFVLVDKVYFVLAELLARKLALLCELIKNGLKLRLLYLAMQIVEYVE